MKKIILSTAIGIASFALIAVFSPGGDAEAHGYVPHFKSMGVTEVTANSAVLTGSVDSMHSSANGHAWFEYGTNPQSGNYGSSWPWKAGIRGLPQLGLTDMRTKITGLQPNTTYYFRLLAENKNGKNVSEIMSFTTKSGSSSQTTPKYTSNKKNNRSSYISNTTNTVNNTTNTSNYYYQYLQYQQNNQSQASQHTESSSNVVTYKPSN